MEILSTHEWTELSLRDNVDSGKCSVETRLEYGFPTDYMYFQ